MSNILQEEDKKYLRKVCRYLGSLGMNHAYITFDLSEGSLKNNTNWDYITHFSNNYRAEIPEGLIPILKRIIDNIDKKDLIEYVDVDNVMSEMVEILINCESGEISVSYDYSFLTAGDGSSSEWILEEMEGKEKELLEGIFERLKNEFPNEKYLEITYNGSGDSGYLEDTFNNGKQVPADLENWCYDVLEKDYGGWEINEGSQGNFEFYLNNESIYLNHQYNVEETGSDTVWEENFR